MVYNFFNDDILYISREYLIYILYFRDVCTIVVQEMVIERRNIKESPIIACKYMYHHLSLLYIYF